MITIETCAQMKMNETYNHNIREDLMHILTINGRVDHYYAAMMIKAAELRTFYATDLFDAFVKVLLVNGNPYVKEHEHDEDFLRGYYNSGSYMNAWSLNGLISPTGNERMVDIPLYDDVYRRVPAKEWKANFTAEDVQAVLSALYGMM